MIKKPKANNLGAISALKGYRVQFLYSLSRILSYKKSEAEFHPEGKYEDLDIYNDNGEVIEIIQVKDLGNVLTLSDITTSKKENTFLKRAIKAYKEGNTPKIKLVSFGKINDDVKNLSNPEYSKKFIAQLNKQGLNNDDIKILKGNFAYEIVNEHEVEKDILTNIEEWGTLVDLKITLNLLTYWIYHSAEKQETITPENFKKQFDQICKFQNERISFNKTYNSLIQPLDSSINNENIESLKSDFYRGVSATYKHILHEVDVKRIDKLKSIKDKFYKSNIVFIHGASGQGKSTLAYRYLNEYCNGNTIYELKHLPDDISIIYNVINALEGISKGIRFPITIYIDVEAGNKEWVSILRELASNMHFNFLVTIREEDWNSIEIGDKFSFSEIELLFDKEEAKLIYESLNDFNEDLKFIDFNNAWDTFGGNGPLLEFVYLITQQESLSAKLKSQINKIRNDSSVIGNEKIKLLRYIVLADCFGSKIKLKEFNDFLQLNSEILFLIDLLQKEYLIKISGNKTYITGLHPVRSEIIKELLFDNEINNASDFALEAIAFISDNTILNFLRNAFRYSNLSTNKLLAKLKDSVPQKWQSYHQILRSLLWKGIYDYVNKNISLLAEVYTEYSKGWITIVNFDFADVLEGKSVIENSNIFTEEQKQYAKTINARFSDKKEIFNYSLSWLNDIKQINLIPDTKDEWDSYGHFLFWLVYLKKTDIDIDFKNFKFEINLNNQPIYILAYALYSVKMYNKSSKLHIENLEKLFCQRLAETYKVILVDQTKRTIECQYLFDIIDEEIDSDESDFINAKSMKIIDLLRVAFPNKDSYGTKGVGHQFSFLENNYDPSKKLIPKKNLPLKPLVEINSTYINLFNYTTRPTSWLEYVELVKIKRESFLKVTNRLVSAFKKYHKEKRFEPLRLYVLFYSELHTEIKNQSNPLLPVNITDKWGEFGESGLNKNTNQTPAISFERYESFEKIFNDYCTSMENFLWQSANVIISKIKSVHEGAEFDLNTARVSLVGNLYKLYEDVHQFQNSVRIHFEKFMNTNELKHIDRVETDNISILSFLYRQFIYSDVFLKGDVSKLALNRLKETDLSFKKKISNGFKQLSKEFGIQISIKFEESEKRCVILANINNALESFELIEIMYNKLFELIEQPDYNSIKYLIVNTNYPVFNILLLINGKSLNSTWYDFKTYNLREKSFEKLAQFNLIPQEIPSNFIDKYNIEVWNKTLIKFQYLDKFLESASMSYQLAFHFNQMKEFENKDFEDYSLSILNTHVQKTSSLFQKNIQTILDLIWHYNELSSNDKIDFEEDEKEVFEDLLFEIRRYTYPNENLYKKGKMEFTLGTKILKKWIPRLEIVNNKVPVIYFFLAGKIIEEKLYD
ncbi:MAG: hypothetical protein GQ564_19725 [Bacteroidales bacterium]|nr:hypothetical protein [Bacteroidales bacterium]